MSRLVTAVTDSFQTNEVEPRLMDAAPGQCFVVLTAGGRRAQGWVRLDKHDDSNVLVAHSPHLLANPEVDKELAEKRDAAIRGLMLVPPTRLEMLWHGVFQLADKLEYSVEHRLPIHLVEGTDRLDETTRTNAHFLQSIGFLPNSVKGKDKDGKEYFVLKRDPKMKISNQSGLT